MSALLQWLAIGAIVLACGLYAARTLLPHAARLALARRLRASGRATLAARLEGGAGCEACAHRAPRAAGARPTGPPAPRSGDPPARRPAERTAEGTAGD